MRSLLAVARNQPEAIAQHQQAEDHDRQRNAPGQRLDGTVADSLIPIQEEKSGKQASDHANQQKNDDELENGQFH